MAEAVEKSLFEEGYLRRSLGAIATSADVALSELVANAWDAGASKVEISIPDRLGGIISVRDDGVGMSPEDFRSRWMKLGYNRTKHQGEFAEFPPLRRHWKRRAYGRNGVGRHGLLCFADRYAVDTRRYDAEQARRFSVEPSSGDSAFVLMNEEPVSLPDHGTAVWAHVQRDLPEVEEVRDALSFKFLHDPQFTIFVNGEAITLESHPLVAQTMLEIDDYATATVLCFEVEPSKRRKAPHGVAFWVGHRLVGEPTYSLHGNPLIDGRSTVANRHMIVVKSDDLFNDVAEDWSGFRKTPRIAALSAEVGQYVNRLVTQLNAERIEESKKEALRENKEEIKKLKPLGRIELTEFLDDLVQSHPTLNVEILTSAVKAAVNLEKSRSGAALLEKLSVITEEDAERLNRILETWTMRDALAVLDEIDRRLSVIAAIERLMDDPDADEVHTIHPLVTHARWLFGPEYDTTMYASNITLQKAASRVFKKKIDPNGVGNPRQRPDLLFLKESTVSFTGTEEFNCDSTVVSLRNVLLIELKKGNSTIVLKHMQQAQQYVQDILSCELLDGAPFIHAFVVGHKVDQRIRPNKVGDNPEVARIEPCSFGQLVRTANKRLFRLQETLKDRYPSIPELELLNKVLGEPTQYPLFTDAEPRAKPKRKRGKPAANGASSASSQHRRRRSDVPVPGD